MQNGPDEGSKDDNLALRSVWAGKRDSRSPRTSARAGSPSELSKTGNPIGTSKGKEALDAEADLEAGTARSHQPATYRSTDSDAKTSGVESEHEEVAGHAVDAKPAGENEDIKDIKDSDSLTTISNETALSEFDDMPETQRQAAQVIAEPPWAGFMKPCWKFLAACALPPMLALLLVCGFVKFLGFLLQCTLDAFNLALRLVYLALRAALAPLYLLWRAIVPSWIREMLNDIYEEHVGRRLLVVFNFKREVEEILADLPALLRAIVGAGVATCVTPVQTRCHACLYWIIGRHTERWVLTPMHDREINRRGKQRKHLMMKAQMNDAKAQHMTRKKTPKQKRAKMLRDRKRAKMLLNRKKMLEVKLQLPVNHKFAHTQGQSRIVQFPERARSDRISRTMVVERRYAIAVGFVWSSIGTIILVITLDGDEWDRCLVCAEQTELGVSVCRHRFGRDCAFNLHTREIIISIALIAVGGLLMVYASFLYRPRSRPARKERKAQARKQEQEAVQTQLLVAEKREDPELGALRLVLARLNEPTPGRSLRRSLKRWECTSCQSCLASLTTRLLAALFRWEQRHKLQERSILLQDALYFLVIGWAKAALQKLAKFMHFLTCQRWNQDAQVDAIDWADQQGCISCLCSNSGQPFLLLRCFKKRRSSDRFDTEKAGPGLRRQSWGGTSQMIERTTLEDVLDRFGLAVAEDAGAAVAAKRGGLGDLNMEIAEKQQEFGQEAEDNEQPEDEPGLAPEEENTHLEPIVEEEEEEAEEEEETEEEEEADSEGSGSLLGTGVGVSLLGPEEEEEDSSGDANSESEASDEDELSSGKEAAE